MQDISIIYETKDFLALSKPAGIVVHHDAQHTSGTVVDWLLEKYPEIRGVGEDVGHRMSNRRPMSREDIGRPGIVHRLDKDTSGILLVAKNQRAYEYLKKLFQDGDITKKYFALVVGNIKNDSGVINAPIARSTKYFEKRVVGGKQGRAREARTEYRVLERFPAFGDPISKYGDRISVSGYTLLEVSPKTGRTHQIRSHLAHIGHPVACDKLYGGKLYQCPANLARQFLHAHSLSFTGPDGTKLEIEAPLSPDLQETLKSLRMLPV